MPLTQRKDMQNQSEPVGHADSGEDSAKIGPDRVSIQFKFRADLLVLLTLEDSGHDPRLLRRELEHLHHPPPIGFGKKCRKGFRLV